MVHINAFEKEIQKHVKMFVEFWYANYKQNPEIWPLELEATVDWLEQFFAFVDSISEHE